MKYFLSLICLVPSVFCSADVCADEWNDCANYNSSACQNDTYEGSRDFTITDKTCQNWAVQTPHAHGFGAVGSHNFCRNPDGKAAPWCYTTDPGTVWDFCFRDCSIPHCVDAKHSCAVVPGSAECLSDTYRGTKDVTYNGLPCQQWSLDFPQSHSLNSVGDHNFCRNPDGEDGPWCYTTDPLYRWELCFPPCAYACIDQDNQCAKYSSGFCATEVYEGPRSVTRTGRTCQQWNVNVPHQRSGKYETSADNLCRHTATMTMTEKGPWCYTIDPDIRWEYCFEPCEPFKPCIDEARQCRVGDILDCELDLGGYNGNKVTTRTGVPCVPWDQVTVDYFMKIPVGHNQCRSVHKKEPFCYVDTAGTWDFCFDVCPATTTTTAIPPICRTFETVLVGYRMSNHILASHPASSHRACMKLCMDTGWCVSISYRPQGGLCDLHHRRRHDKDVSFTQEAGAQVLDSLVW